MRRRAIGVDFSGARDAGRAIWIAEGRVGPGGLALEDCRPAEKLPGGARDRATALAALVDHLGAQSDAVIGCDFPVGLPEKLVRETDWPAFLARFPKRHASAETFRADCRKRSAEETKRCTDKVASTPMCAWNLRLYKQTYHGIANVLAPLVALGRATVGPMQEPIAGRAWILETCPASVLKKLGLYEEHKSYKVRSRVGREVARARRQIILDFLVSAGRLREPSTDLRTTLLDDRGGDALDAVIAALAAAAALRRKHQPANKAERIEGRVYFAI
jgi:Protein of unknown function (DUF429)